jgi:feruloyl esterase
MNIALQEGYATASTDTGHKGGNALFAIDHPEKLTDFAYRAIHEMTVQAKAIISAYYSRAPRLSYFNGCSTGGRQGLMEAQKFPEDFDAIVAGAPANYQTHLHVWDLSVSVPVLKNPAAAVSAETLALVNKAVVQACDARDGITDGILNDPRACKFDVSTLQCKQGDAQTCLTAAQVEAVQRVYEPAKTASGEVVFPGKEFGSETGWIGVLGGQQAPGVSVGSFLVAYNDAKWDAKTFDLNRDLKIVDEKVGVPVNAINPDLRAFKARGGKLILYHGWNDTAISPATRSTITRACSPRWVRNGRRWDRSPLRSAATRTTGFDCSWRPGCSTAAEALDRIRSTGWPRSSGGGSRGSRRTRSKPCTSRTTAST